MTITKRPASSGQAQSADDFISRAPDAAHDAEAGTTRRRKEVISLGIDGGLLKRIDAVAARSGLSRAATISLAVARFVEEKGE